MNIAQVQLVRKLVLTIAALLAAVAAMVTASIHRTGEPFHEIIEWTGLLMMFVCIAGRSWTSLYIGGRKITEFVTIGPYSVVRNPLYVFSIIGAMGAGAQTGSVLGGLIFGVVVWAVFHIVVRREEQVLADRYGEQFEAYKARVRRFLPDMRLWRDISIIPVMPSRALRTFADGMFFLLAVPLAEAIEHFQQSGVLPVLLRIY